MEIPKKTKRRTLKDGWASEIIERILFEIFDELDSGCLQNVIQKIASEMDLSEEEFSLLEFCIKREANSRAFVDRLGDDRSSWRATLEEG